MRRLAAVASCGLTLAALASPARAHSLAIRQTEDARAVVVDCYYADGATMAYGEVRVFSPDIADAPFSNGRADRLGRFAFAPDRPGAWRIEAKDHEGHSASAVLTVGEAQASPGPWRRPRTWLLFASLAVNIGFFAWWAEARRRKPA